MTENQLVRFYLGNISEEELPDLIISLMLGRYSDRDTSLKIFYCCCDCLRWLIASATSKGETYTERSETIDEEQIKIKGISKVQGWKDLLSYLIEHPDYINPSLNSLSYRVVIGGVRQSQYNKVKSDPNGIGPFDHQNNCLIDFNF